MFASYPIANSIYVIEHIIKGMFVLYICCVAITQLMALLLLNINRDVSVQIKPAT